MSTSAQEPAAYKHSRWLSYIVTIGFGFICLCGLTAANIIPLGFQEHGWPFVYMERLDRVPGPLPNILYGPWPFYDPPLVSFRPLMLAANVLCGAFFVAISILAAKYWLLVRQQPFHFTVRTLLVLMTAVACVCGAMKTWFPSANYPLIAAYGSAELRWFGPLCFLLVAAHWLVVRGTRAGRSPRWKGLHRITWIAMFAIGAPFLHFWLTTNGSVYGWPFRYVDKGYFKSLGFTSYSGEATFEWPALVGDILIWAVIVAATAWVAEGWVRRVEQRQPTRKIAILALAIAIVATVGLFVEDDKLRPETYEFYAVFAGLTALIFTIELLPFYHWQAIPKWSMLSAIAVGAASWFTLPTQVPNDRIVVGLSILAGAVMATAIDGGRRYIARKCEGSSRLLGKGCGESVAFVPIWIIGAVGIVIGFAMALTSS
jgi:hypothetical protein